MAGPHHTLCLRYALTFYPLLVVYTHDVLSRQLYVARDLPNRVRPPNYRLPLNVNDSELHPDMAKLPVEYPRATEMIYVLLKYEGPLWAQQQRAQIRNRKKVDPRDIPGINDSESLTQMAYNFSFDDLERLFHEKYLRNCDPNIPLHAAALATVRSAMCGARYMIARLRAGDSTAQNDELFDHATRVLELDKANREIPFAPQLRWHTGPIRVDAVIYLLTAVKQQGNGERVAKAWDLIVQFWDEHNYSQSEDEAPDQNKFFIALADLTLEAWQARKKELIVAHGQAMLEHITPACITRLEQIRGRTYDDSLDSQLIGSNQFSNDQASTENMPQPSALDSFDIENMPSDLFSFGNDLLYEFGFWNDVPQMI